MFSHARTSQRRGRRAKRSGLVAGCAAWGLLAVAALPAAASAPAHPSASASPHASAPQPGRAQGGGPRDERAHNDVLFVGAHPDDEYQSLAALGQWHQRQGLSTGVATLTRGEGGGNAAGPEEGAELGLIREKEERSAVRPAGIRNVFYLDRPDSWYTLSAPLTQRLWAKAKAKDKGDDGAPARRADTLERLVRLIRATTPRTVVTMDPRPFDQHGAHQTAARLATEAFRLAGDPAAFPHQLTREGYRPWRADRLLAQNWGFHGPAGARCARARDLRDPHTGLPQTGAWEGTRPRRGHTTWAQRERDAARKYVTQGFGSLPAKVTTPRARMGCDWFSVLARHGKPVRAPVRAAATGGGELRPLYAEFRDWARKVGMPWLANGAQPAYPEPPSTSIPAASRRPAVDGAGSPGEYPGTSLRLRHWQGDNCTSAADCSATARLSRHGGDLYALVHVTDDTRGSALKASDCKRHWRTDSVEIALDPRGDSDDTSTTFKAGILPFTSGGGACAGRDADNHQGPAARTAPGMRVASKVSRPYKGYTVEAKIPLNVLPASVDPHALTADVLVYDSDTKDRTGQTRLAWSPYGSAQADPYVWGSARLPGYRPPGGAPSRTAPVIPTEAAHSSDSPVSVAQSRRTGVPLAAGPRHPRHPGPRPAR